MIPRRLVVATANSGKVTELRTLLGEWGPLEVLSLDEGSGVELPAETGATYAENAIAKARTAASAFGLPALGDDSGLEVVALGGAPGVHSARYAATDAARIARLVEALALVGEDERGARFRCVVALAWPDGRIETAEGTCPGRIARAPAGRGGFGYDPIFVADELGCTFAEALPSEKDRMSHRARALRVLRERIAPRQSLRARGRAW